MRRRGSSGSATCAAIACPAGEAPACAQACPHEAIAIRVVDKVQVTEDAEADHFLPAAPEPHLTLPTTRYKTKRVFPRNMLPADYYSVSPQHPHWPLIVMLVLTQLSVGAFGTGVLLQSRIGVYQAVHLQATHAGMALFFGVLALTASLLHLGRPQFAWRAVVGLRHSWLSREILAFGVFAGLATVYAAAPFVLPGADWRWLGGAVVASGAMGVFCSVMIYVATHREFMELLQDRSSVHADNRSSWTVDSVADAGTGPLLARLPGIDDAPSLPGCACP